MSSMWRPVAQALAVMLCMTAFAGPSTQIQLALASIEKKKGFSLHSSERERERASVAAPSSLSTSDPTVTGRSLVSGQLDDSL